MRCYPKMVLNGPTLVLLDKACRGARRVKKRQVSVKIQSDVKSDSKAGPNHSTNVLREVKQEAQGGKGRSVH